MKLIVLKNNVPSNDVEVDIPDIEERYEIFVGRADDCHVLIDDPLISRHHFVIKNEGSDWYCEKLTTLGVVLVNGSVAQKTKLNGNGDEIKCGAYSILVVDLPKPKMAAPLVVEMPVYTPPPPSQPVYEAPKPVAPVFEPLPLMEEEPLLEEVQTEEVTEIIEEESTSEDPYDGDALIGEDNHGSSPEESFGGDVVASDAGSGDASMALESFADEAPAEGDGGGSDNESTRFFKAFVNYQLVLFGDLAPYDRYLIDTDEVFIGRDTKKCQIILDDPEVSSIHAVVRKRGNDVTLEDLNSSNGTILNGERINKAHVHTGDDFIVGSTTFTLEVRSELLDAESERLMPVEAGQVIETEEIEEEEVSMEDGDINFDADAAPEKSFIKRIWKNPAQRKKLIIGGAVCALLWVLLGDDKKDIPTEVKKVEAKADDKNKTKDGKPKLQLSPEQMNRMSVAYELGVSFFEQNKYNEAHKEFETVITIDPDYKKAQTYLEQTKIALKNLEEMDVKKRAEIERLEKKKKIEEIMVKARDAVKERKVAVAETFFSQIAELDPENSEIAILKLELDTWQKEEERKALEEASKIAARKKMVDQIGPGKTFYLKKEWYRAILKLEEFMRIKGMDEDLVKDGSDMLSDAKNQLASELGPLLGKARSLKEGQDFKNAYESYLEILKLEPTNAESLNEVDEIKSQLEMRSKRIYREAIISESLSLFTDAKEKFMEVQQISPTDSEYYRKATDKLKNYME